MPIIKLPHTVKRTFAIYSVLTFCIAATAGEVDLTDFDASIGYEVRGFKPNSVPCQVVSGIGDFNGDDLADFVLGSPLSNEAYVVFGSTSNGGLLELQTFDFNNSRGIKIRGATTDALALELSAAGDVNGDGLDDLLLATWSGRAYLVFGMAGQAANIDLNSPNSAGRVTRFTKTGVDSFGSYVSAAGDFNGDGLGDFVISAITENPHPGLYGRQVDYLILGKTEWSGNVDLAGFASGDTAGVRIFSGYFDINIAPKLVGEYNGDGFSDILVGSNRVILGRSSGLADIAGDASGPSDKVISVPETHRTNIGTGDYNNDNLDDIIGADNWSGMPSTILL